MKLIGIRISQEAHKRFEKIHEQSGLKTKGQTFEALVFREGNEEESPHKRLNQIESKLDHVIEWLGISS